MKDFWHLVGVEELQIMAAVDRNFILVDFILLFCQMGIRVKLVIYLVQLQRMNGIYGGRKFQSGEGIISALFVFGPDKTG